MVVKIKNDYSKSMSYSKINANNGYNRWLLLEFVNER